MPSTSSTQREATLPEQLPSSPPTSPSEAPIPAAPGGPSAVPFPKAGRFLGVDWSGSAQAGRKVWAAALIFAGSDGARLESVRRPFPGRLDAAGVADQF